MAFLSSEPICLKDLFLYIHFQGLENTKMGCGGSKDTQTSSQSQPKTEEQPKKDEKPAAGEHTSLNILPDITNAWTCTSSFSRPGRLNPILEADCTFCLSS